MLLVLQQQQKQKPINGFNYLTILKVRTLELMQHYLIHGKVAGIGENLGLFKGWLYLLLIMIERMQEWLFKGIEPIKTIKQVLTDTNLWQVC